ncbi:MAG TPA: MATE family efflux transporter, partial [Firmicutes bacterium]|nr:MATE family efflux transporter [Bacillota bacterium]
LPHRPALTADAEESGKITRNMAVMVMSAMGLVFFFAPGPLVGIFSKDPEVMELAVVCLRLVAVAQPALAVWMVLAGGLRGAGDTRAIMKIVAVGFLFVRLGLAYLLAVHLNYGLIGAWVAMVTDLFLRGFLIHRRFRQGKWKTVRI